MKLYQFDKYAYPTGKTQEVGDRDPIPPGWTDQEPPASDGYRFVGHWQGAPTRQDWLNRPQILGPAKEQQEHEAKQAYYARLKQGFDDADGVTWAVTDNALTKILDYTQRIQEYRAGKVASPLPNGKSTVKLPDVTGTAHDMGPDDIVALAEQGSDFKDQVEDRLEELLASIEAATSHDDLDAIDVTSGWPT